jgi:hypothetical protein
MRRATGNIVLILAIALFIASSVDGLTRILAQAKYASVSWWGSDKYAYGDLYGMTYLPQFHIPVDKPEQPMIQCHPPQQGYHIYAISDSYTWDAFKNPANFCGAEVSGYAASNFRDVLPVTLSSTAKNIVVIETNERNIRSLLADTAYLAKAIHPIKPGEDTSKLETMNRRKGFHFNYKMRDADANFEFNLWDYRFLTPLKELKAAITYNWFGRHVGEVVVADDKKQLLYSLTIDTALNQSAFKSFSKAEEDSLVMGLNRVYAHYKTLGFNEVYLTMIPNPVSILYPNYHGMQYNQLIPKLQNNPNLKLKVFDSYTLFRAKKDSMQLYRKSDTHWTMAGEKLWLQGFNRMIQQDMK